MSSSKSRLRSWPWCKALQCDLFCRTDAGWDCQDTYRTDAIELEATPAITCNGLHRHAPDCPVGPPRLSTFAVLDRRPLWSGSITGRWRPVDVESSAIRDVAMNCYGARYQPLGVPERRNAANSQSPRSHQSGGISRRHDRLRICSNRPTRRSGWAGRGSKAHSISRRSERRVIQVQDFAVSVSLSYRTSAGRFGSNRHPRMIWRSATLSSRAPRPSRT